MAELPTALTGGVEIPADAANPSGIAQPREGRCNGCHEHEIPRGSYGGRIADGAPRVRPCGLNRSLIKLRWQSAGKADALKFTDQHPRYAPGLSPFLFQPCMAIRLVAPVPDQICPGWLRKTYRNHQQRPAPGPGGH